MRTTTNPTIHQRARWRRRGDGSAGRSLGMRTEWEPNVRYSGANGTGCRRSSRKIQVSRSLAPRGSGSPSGPGGARDPSGTPRSRSPRRPARCPHSPSTLWRTSPPTAICGRRPPPPRPPRTPAWRSRRPAARRARPAIRGTPRSTRSPVSPPPSRIWRRSIVTSDVGQPRRRLLDRAAVGDAPAPRPRTPRRRRTPRRSCPRTADSKTARWSSSGPSSSSPLDRRRAAEAVEQPVLVVTQRPLDRAAQHDRHRRRAARRAGR